MKKFLSLCCLAALLLAGCGKEPAAALSSDNADATQTVIGQVQEIDGNQVTLQLGRLEDSQTDGQTFTAGEETQTVSILSNLAIQMPEGTDGILSDISEGDVLELELSEEGRVKTAACRLKAETQTEAA